MKDKKIIGESRSPMTFNREELLMLIKLTEWATCEYWEDKQPKECIKASGLNERFTNAFHKLNEK